MCSPALPPLRSPSSVTPPLFRHRNSPSCEKKVPEFKTATGYYLYSGRKDVFLHSVYFVVVATAPAAGSRLWHRLNISRGQVGGEEPSGVRGSARPAQKCLVSLPESRAIGPGKPEKEAHGLDEVFP